MGTWPPHHPAPLGAASAPELPFSSECVGFLPTSRHLLWPRLGAGQEGKALRPHALSLQMLPARRWAGLRALCTSRAGGTSSRLWKRMVEPVSREGAACAGSPMPVGCDSLWVWTCCCAGRLCSKGRVSCSHSAGFRSRGPGRVSEGGLSSHLPGRRASPLWESWYFPFELRNLRPR